MAERDKPRERRRKTTYKPTISIPADYNPVRESLADALLRQAGLPTQSQDGQIKPDNSSIASTEGGVRKGGDKHGRRY